MTARRIATLLALIPTGLLASQSLAFGAERPVISEQVLVTDEGALIRVHADGTWTAADPSEGKVTFKVVRAEPFFKLRDDITKPETGERELRYASGCDVDLEVRNNTPLPVVLGPFRLRSGGSINDPIFNSGGALDLAPGERHTFVQNLDKFSSSYRTSEPVDGPEALGAPEPCEAIDGTIIVSRLLDYDALQFPPDSGIGPEAMDRHAAGVPGVIDVAITTDLAE